MSVATDCSSANTEETQSNRPLESTQGRCGQHPPSDGTSEDQRLTMSMLTVSLYTGIPFACGRGGERSGPSAYVKAEALMPLSAMLHMLGSAVQLAEQAGVTRGARKGSWHAAHFCSPVHKQQTGEVYLFWSTFQL